MHRGSYQCSQREIIKEVSEDLPDVGISIPTHMKLSSSFSQYVAQVPLEIHHLYMSSIEQDIGSRRSN